MSLVLRGNFCKHQCAIILQHIDVSCSMLLEFCGTYFGTNRGGLGAMFEVSVPDDFFEDEDEDPIALWNYAIFPDAIGRREKEEVEDGLRISQGLTQESTQEQLNKVLQAIKIECEGGHQLACTLTLYCHVFYRCAQNTNSIRRGCSAHPNVVFERMDDDTPNSIKDSKDFHENIWYYQRNGT